AHGRRADLGEMGGRPVLADRLALALLQAQQVDDGGTEEEHEQQRRHDGAAGAEGDVAENVQRPDLVAEAHQRIEHSLYPPGLPGPNRATSAATSGAMRVPSEPFTITTSPAWTASIMSGSSSAEVGAQPPCLVWGRSASSSCIIGPQASTRSTPAAEMASFSPRCRLSDASPSSSMSPSTATRRGKASRGVCPMAASAARTEAGLAL